MIAFFGMWKPGMSTPDRNPTTATNAHTTTSVAPANAFLAGTTLTGANTVNSGGRRSRGGHVVTADPKDVERGEQSADEERRDDEQRALPRVTPQQPDERDVHAEEEYQQGEPQRV